MIYEQRIKKTAKRYTTSPSRLRRDTTLLQGRYLVEADDGFWVDPDDVQAPAVPMEELSEEPQEDSADLLILWGETQEVGVQAA